jgi:hypothetical protein
MTPKNILSKIVYIIAGCVAVPGLILFVPGGLFILAALCIGCGADKLEDQEFNAKCDLTIEEYEKGMGVDWDAKD